MIESPVKGRITTAPMCDVIALTEAESALYKGAGLALARFKGAELAGLWYVGSAMPSVGAPQEAANQALEAATAWHISPAGSAIMPWTRVSSP